MGWSQKLIGLDRKSWASSTQRRAEADLGSAGALMQSSSGTFVLASSRAGYQALEPNSDATVLEVDGKHAFTAVMSSDFTARGASYLSRNLAREVQSQVQATPGDLTRAFLTAISNLNAAFQRIHPFNGPVLEGVRIAAVYLDTSRNTLHLASNGGGAKCAVGSRLPDGSFALAATVGSDQPASSDPAGCTVQKLQLDSSVDTVVIGSPGLWRELTPENALLRLSHYHDSVPAANGGNAAAHLTNHALHAVTRRLHSSRDPRMRCLREVHHLQSLLMGDKSNFKSNRRQPLQRRRGDVHGDFSSVVLHLQWEGQEGYTAREPCRLRHSQSTPSVGVCPSQRPTAAGHWALLRLHFLDFPRASRQQAVRKWQAVAQAALEQARSEAKNAVPIPRQRSKRTGEIVIRASSRDLDSIGVVSVSA